MPKYKYQYYGLTLQSELPIVELLAAGDSPADVVCTRGLVPAALANAVMDNPVVCVGADGTVLLRAPAGARYLVRDGCSVTAEFPAGWSGPMMDGMMAGMVAGALLHQRGELPLHAATVVTASGAVMLAGPTRRGKSTLATALVQSGARLLADDISVVRFDGDGAAWVLPGVGRLRLWQDGADALGLDFTALVPMRLKHPKAVFTPPEVLREPQRVIAMVWMGIDRTLSAPKLTRLFGPTTIAPVENLIYKPQIAAKLGRMSRLFDQLIHLANRIPIYRLARNEKLEQLPLLVDLVSGLER